MFYWYQNYRNQSLRSAIYSIENYYSVSDDYKLVMHILRHCKNNKIKFKKLQNGRKKRENR